jgi:NarL family two-component system response regulator LiaR
VVLADDHPLFLRGLEAALEREGLEIVGLAASGEEVLEVATQVEPEVVLLDVSMPGMDGIECLGELRRRFPEVKVVMLSGSDDQQVVDQCLDAGALCFVGKSVQPADIAHALRAVSGNLEIRYQRSNAPRPAPAGASSSSPSDTGLLTRREREILSMVAEGGSNSELGRQLWVTEQTVKFHLSNIDRKLEVSNRTQAARRGWELGLIDSGAGPSSEAVYS